MSNKLSLRGKSTQFLPGQSGNPGGRPIGSRNQFSAALISDLAASWAQHGPAVLETVAVSDPVRYLGIAASLIPKDVQVSIEQRLPGGLDPDDWQLACSVFEAVKAALPNANDRPPGEVLTFVLDAIRSTAPS